MAISKCTINGITVNGDHSIAINDDTNNWVITTNTLSYNNKLAYADNVKYWRDSVADKPKHFNCPFCGAPNQIDVCEYCGSAYEGGNE